MNEIVKVFEGKEIMFKMVDGEVYCSATSMAKAFPSKNLSTWINSKGTEEYITELCAENGRTKYFYIDVNKGGTEQGTWIHEQLCLDLARWLSPKFRVWADNKIAELIRDGEVKITKQDSYIIENPVERAKRWIEEYEEKLALENKIQEDAPLVSLAEERLSFDDCVSITDISRTFNIKRGYLTSWAKKNGYIHKTITEVNQAGLEYFKIYDNGGFKSIGITKKGLKFIEMNLEEIKTKSLDII